MLRSLLLLYPLRLGLGKSRCQRCRAGAVNSLTRAALIIWRTFRSNWLGAAAFAKKAWAPADTARSARVGSSSLLSMTMATRRCWCRRWRTKWRPSLPAEVFRKGLQPEGIVIDQQNAREVTHRCSGANTSIRL